MNKIEAINVDFHYGDFHALKPAFVIARLRQSNMAGRVLESPDIVLRIWGLRNMTIAIL